MNTKLGRRKYLTREGGSPHSCSALYVDVTVTTVMMVSAVRGPQCNTPGIASWRRVELEGELISEISAWAETMGGAYFDDKEMMN